MPPPQSLMRLSAEEIEKIRRWIIGLGVPGS
jgi:hypothetical protein